MKKISLVLFFVFCASILVAQNNNTPQSGKKKMKVFVLSGQSNMVGWGDNTKLSDSLRFGTDNKLMFEDGKWKKLKPHKKPNKGQREKGKLTEFSFGPEISLAEAISKAYPNQTIGIIKSATGGTGILAWSPNWSLEQANRTGDGKKGDLYKVLIDKVKAAQKEADVEIVGFLWQQGGKDMTRLEVGKNYYENLKSLIEGLRADLNFPELPVFVGCSVSKESLYTVNKTELERIKKSRPAVEYVILARFKAEEEIPNVKVVVSPDLEKHHKNVHYNTNGQLELGEYYAKYFLKSINKK